MCQNSWIWPPTFHPNGGTRPTVIDTGTRRGHIVAGQGLKTVPAGDQVSIAEGMLPRPAGSESVIVTASRLVGNDPVITGQTRVDLLSGWFWFAIAWHIIIGTEIVPIFVISVSVTVSVTVTISPIFQTQNSHQLWTRKTLINETTCSAIATNWSRHEVWGT